MSATGREGIQRHGPWVERKQLRMLVYPRVNFAVVASITTNGTLLEPWPSPATPRGHEKTPPERGFFS